MLPESFRHVSTFDGLCEIEVGLPEKTWLEGEQYIDVPTTSQALKIAKRPVPLIGMKIGRLSGSAFVTGFISLLKRYLMSRN